ncbi:hypothetical protein ACIGB6_02900 [Paeniglutamicibacter gangotriensis]|uniref:hypothetical protein n=1 Tax=Paeniglutamicibacter gangotriensis TaxID=254787 RepID=UPI0037C8F381
MLDESDITLMEKALNLDSEAVIEGCRTDNGPEWMALMLADAERMLAAAPPNAAIGGFAKVGPIGPNRAGEAPDSKFGRSHP